MRLEDYFEFIAPNDIRLKGHRIGIETILLDYFEQGLSAEEIAERYPTINAEKVHATLTYYWHNQTAVDAYLQAVKNHETRMFQEQSVNPPKVVKQLYEFVKERRSRGEELVIREYSYESLSNPKEP